MYTVWSNALGLAIEELRSARLMVHSLEACLKVLYDTKQLWAKIMDRDSPSQQVSLGGIEKARQCARGQVGKTKREAGNRDQEKTARQLTMRTTTVADKYRREQG